MINKLYKRSLPSGYTQLDYIESSGTQYINTGVLVDATTYKIELVAARTSTANTTSYLLGIYTSGLTYGLYTSSSELTTIKGVWTNSSIGYTYSVDAYSTYYLDYGNFKVDGTTIGTFVASGTNSTYPIYLFGRNTSGTASAFAKMKVKSCKIYNGDTLVRNFVPAKRESDSAIGMYDLVNKVFYGNDGTGTFSYGTEVPISKVNEIKMYKQKLPSAYQEVEYLQASGNTYIDLNVYCGENQMKAEWEQTLESTATNVYPFGASSDSGTRRFMVSYPYNNYCSGYGTGESGYIVAQIANVTAGTSIVSIEQNGSNFTTKYGSLSSEVSNCVPKAVSNSLYLFAQNYNGTARYGGTRQISWFKLYENNVLIRNLIPCYRKSDNVAGMYDLVTNTFYTNAGTGTFSVGADVSGFVHPKLYLGVKKIKNTNYQEVEYLQSSGTQYIDTGVIPSDATNMELDVVPVAFGSNKVIAGSRVTANDTAYNIFKMSSGAFRFDLSNLQRTTGTATISTKYKLAIKDNKCYVDDTEYTFSGTLTSFTSSYPIYLFALNQAGSTTLNSTCQIYSCKIWQDGTTLSRNLIPCYRKSDSVAGMYDLANTDNLFDKDVDGTAVSVSLANTYGNQKIFWSNGSSSICIPIKPYKTYTVKCVGTASGTIFRAATTTRKLTSSDGASNPFTPTSIVRNESGVFDAITITAGQNDAYLYVQFSAANYTANTEITMVVEGSTEPTEYKPFPFYTNSGTGTFTKGSDCNTIVLEQIYGEES